MHYQYQAFIKVNKIASLQGFNSCIEIKLLLDVSFIHCIYLKYKHKENVRESLKEGHF